MLKSDYIRFSDQRAIYTNIPYDGFLSFLPEPVMDHVNIPEDNDLNLAAHLSFRTFEGRDFRWFEFRDTKLSTALSLKIGASESYLWLLINMRTGISVTLDTQWLVPTDRLLCYQTFIEQHEIAVPDKSSWFLLLGIGGHMIRDITVEYPALRPLLAPDTTAHLSSRTIGTKNLHAKLKRILEQLRQMEFRPFSTYYQLANWNMRFFQLVFQEMEPQLAEKTDYDIELYYKAIAYMRENFYDDQMNVESIASILHVNRRTLERVFVNKRFTVTEQILEFRLQEARELIIHTDRSIMSIAYSLNFACPKNFKRVFTKRFMLSPMQYREGMTLKRLF